MANYRYRATDQSGKTVKGTLAAADENDLYEKLKQMDRFLLSAEEIVDKKQGVTLRQMELAEFCRQIGTLLGAGVSLVRALGILTEQEGIRDKAQQVYTEVLREIKQGVALSDAMEHQGMAFPPLTIHMFRAAETSGNLDKTAMRLAVYYEKQYRLNEKVKSATTYPKFLSGLMVIVVAILVGFVLPQFEDLFSLMEELPLPTRILYGITDLVKNYWYLLIAGTVLLVMLMRMILRIPKVRIWVDGKKLHIPKIGRLQRIICTARFAQTLSSLYAAGIPIVTSLQIARKTVGNAYIDKQFDDVIPVVRAGGNLSDALDSVDGFDKKFIASVRVGEETGSLDTMLEATSESMEYESEIAINRMVSYLEPMLIIVMALLVGFIMIAVMLPIYQSYSAIETSAYQ